MIGIGKMWQTVTGRDADARPPVPVWPVPRDLANPKVSAADALWDDDDAEPCETRSAPRFVPSRTATTLNTASGRRVAARIINMSRTGVAVEVDVKAIGLDEVVLVGTRQVKAGRRISLGVVFLFKKPLDPKLCDPSIIL